MPRFDPTKNQHPAQIVVSGNQEADRFKDSHQVDTDELDQVSEPKTPAATPSDAKFTLWDV